MNHRQATRHLGDLLTGELAGDRRDELTAHLERCEECRGWSETYGFLSDALRADREAEHPASEQLAHLAVDAALLTAPEREHLAAHLEECSDCRRELELSRDALADSRKRLTVARFPVRLPASATARRLALAASLILAASLTIHTRRPEVAHRGPDSASTVAATAPVSPRVAEPVTVPASPPATAPVTEPPSVRRSPLSTRTHPVTPRDTARALSGSRLAGIQVIEAPGVLTANSIAIENGSEITLRAGEMVVLGDGFSIGSSASLGVEILEAPLENFEQ
ncbi:MAG: zf-HC2 domain-containing protein, partial [Thermoanaerobaculia bacterium]